MTTFEWVQGAVISIVVVASAWLAFRKLLPKTSTRLLAWMSARLNRDGRFRPLRFLGRLLQPAVATSSCGDGCGSCNGCAPATPRPEVHPLRFKPRP